MDIEITTNNFLEFSFKTEKPIAEDKIQLVYYIGTNERNFDISQLKRYDSLVSFKTQFKHKGRYDVHLKIEEDIVATYTIQVAKADIKAMSLVTN